MIWIRDGNELRGLYRPEKNVCMLCAILPIDELWPITNPLDSRKVGRGR
jgi:hypothetical protein